MIHPPYLVYFILLLQTAGHEFYYAFYFVQLKTPAKETPLLHECT